MKLFGKGSAPSRTAITELSKDTVELTFDGSGELKDILAYIRTSFGGEAKGVKGKRVLMRLVDAPDTVASKLAPHLKSAGATLVALAGAGGWKVLIPASEQGTLIPFSDFPKAEAAAASSSEADGGEEETADPDSDDTEAIFTEPEIPPAATPHRAFEILRSDESVLVVQLSFGPAEANVDLRELARRIGDEAATISQARDKRVVVQTLPGVHLFRVERTEIERGFKAAGATDVDGLTGPAPIPDDPQQREAPLFADDPDEL